MGKLMKMIEVTENNEKVFVMEKTITLGESYLTRFLEVYNNKRYEDGQLIEGVIKVSLSKNDGLSQLLNGICYNGHHYEELLTTPSGQKKESDTTKGESLFYNVDTLCGLKEELYRIISADKLRGLEGQEISINKMVSSRLALATSTIEGAIDININRICVVDEYTYKYIGKYSWFNENGELVEGERELEHTFSDGQGLMSNEVAERIRKGLKKDYGVDFAVVRYYHGLAVKGVLLRFDFKTYFKNQGFEHITDIYGNSWNVDDIDMIVNPSMVKWLALHSNITDTNSYYQNSRYREINDRLYICKTNKDPKKLKDYQELNYQALINTNITFNELKKLAEEEVKSYKQINNFEDIDYIRLALGSESAEKSLLGLTLDKLGDEALNLSYVKLLTKSTLEKQIKQLSGGKIRAKGGYKVIATDPIAFCNKIIGIETSDELGVHEYVVGGNEEGFKTIYRNPIALYSEVKKIQLTTREYLKDYTKELIFVNEKDDSLMLSSGADRDGDAYTVIENEILCNACIPCEYPYYNATDGKTKKMVYNHQNYCEALWLSCGNLIGKIANNNSKLCYDVASLSNLVKDENIYSYSEMKEIYKRKYNRINPYDKKEEEELFREFESRTNEMFKNYCDNAEVKRIYEFDEKTQKELITKNFYNNRAKFFKILEASQVAIDMPKTLVGISDELNAELKEIASGLYKPYFMLNLEKAEIFEVNKFHRKTYNINPQDCTMDKFCAYVERECLYKLRNALKTDNGSRGNRAFFELFSGNIDRNFVSFELYKEYKKNVEGRDELTGEQKKSLDSLTLLKLYNLNLTPDIIASTGYYKKMSVRFMMTMFGSLLTENLNKMESKTSELVECNEGEIYWKGKRYARKERENNENAEIDRVTWLKEQVKRGVVKKVRLRGNLSVDTGDVIEVVNGQIDGLTIFENRQGEGVQVDGCYKVIEYEIKETKSVWTTLYVIENN